MLSPEYVPLPVWAAGEDAARTTKAYHEAEEVVSREQHGKILYPGEKGPQLLGKV